MAEVTGGAKPVRVLIADDHALVRLGLRLVLERDGIEVVGEAGTGRQAVEMAMQLLPDVVLLDIVMPDMDGLQALSAIRSSVPQANVIMTTAHVRPDFMARAIALGAAGYVTKSDEPPSIPTAIRSVVEGEAIVSREILSLALSELSQLPVPPLPNPGANRPALTPQQLKVLTLLAEGLSNSSIGQALSVSRNTVKTHVREIFVKLGVTDRTQAAIWWLRNGPVGG